MAFDLEGARKAGYSDSEIADHLAPTLNFDVTAARQSGYSDKDIVGTLSDRANPGVLTAAGRGIAHGTLGLAESVGTGLQFLGNRIGSEGMAQLGESVSQYWANKAEPYAPPQALQGSIIDNPELLAKGSWWAYNLADTVPSLAAAIIPGAGAYRAINIGGKSIGLTDAAISRLAIAGGSVTGGAAGGSLEGAQTYREVLDRGGNEQEAAVAATQMALASAALNAISVGGVLNPSKASALRKFVTTGSTEALTEWAEEPAEGAILSGTYVAKPEDDPMQRAREGLNVAPIAFALGGGAGLIAGRQRDTFQKDFTPPPAPTPEPATSILNTEVSIEPIRQAQTVDDAIAATAAAVDSVDVEQAARDAAFTQIEAERMSGVPDADTALSLKNAYETLQKEADLGAIQSDVREQTVEQAMAVARGEPDETPKTALQIAFEEARAKKGLAPAATEAPASPSVRIPQTPEDAKTFTEHALDLARNLTRSENARTIIDGELERRKQAPSPTVASPAQVATPAKPALTPQTAEAAKYAGVTMAEVEAIQDIPTTEKISEAIAAVGETEFERQTKNKIAKYKPMTPNQEAMLVEATAIEIMALNRRAKQQAPAAATPQPVQATPAPAAPVSKTPQPAAPAAAVTPEPPYIPAGVQPPATAPSAPTTILGSPPKELTRKQLELAAKTGNESIKQLARTELARRNSNLKEGNPSLQLIRILHEMGGINKKEALDIAGDKGVKGLGGVGARIFRTPERNDRGSLVAGRGLDEVALRLVEEGWIPRPVYEESVDGGVQLVRDMVRDALDGKLQPFTDRQVERTFEDEAKARAEAESFSVQAGNTPDNWVTLTKEQQDGQLDEIFGTDSRPSNKGRSAGSQATRAPANQGAVGPAEQAKPAIVNREQPGQLQPGPEQRGSEVADAKINGYPVSGLGDKALKTYAEKSAKPEHRLAAQAELDRRSGLTLTSQTPADLTPAAEQASTAEATKREERAIADREVGAFTLSAPAGTTAAQPLAEPKNQQPLFSNREQPSSIGEQNLGTSQQVPRNRAEPVQKPAPYTNGVQADKVDKPSEVGSFDSEAFDKKRADTVAASRKAGNVHLDKVLAGVETMRGRAIYYAHDPKVKGVIRTADNRGNVYVHWADEYSAQKELASKTEEENKNWLKSSKALPYYREKQGDKTFVYATSLGTNDLKDYVFAKEAAPAKAEKAPVQKKSVSTDREQPAKGERGAITDVGENLWYNRRNFTGKALAWDDVKSLNDTLKIKEVVKTKVWPRPDYEQLVADGLEPFFAHFVKQVYDGIGVAPAGKTDADLQRYIDVVGRVREAVFDWAKDNNANREFLDIIAAKAQRRIGQSGPISISSMYETSKKEHDIRKVIMDRVWPETVGQGRPFSMERPLADIRAIGGNRAAKAIQFTMDDAVTAMKDIEKGWPAKQEAWQKQGYFTLNKADANFSIFESTFKGQPTFVVNYKAQGRSRSVYDSFDTREKAQQYIDNLKPVMLLDKARNITGNYDTQEQAEEAARAQTKREAKGGDLRGMNIEESERKGPDRRKADENVSAQRLQDDFGFRGVNFGREGWINQNERQAYLNHAYDALMDLSDLLGVPPKALSLNNMLGIAFGAQGRGGQAAAHFVPGHNEINLTKTKGAGTLAHEWGHALDHYFATLGDLSKSSDPYLSENVEMVGPDGYIKRYGKKVALGEVRPEVIARFRTIVESMTKRAMTEEEVRLQDNSYRSVALRSLEGWLASFKNMLVSAKDKDKERVFAEFEQLSGRLRRGDMGDGYVKSGNLELRPVIAQIRNLVKDVTGRLPDAETTKGLDSNASHLSYLLNTREAAEEHKPQTTYTTFRKESYAADKAKGGKTYWSSLREMFARAFETYVADKLAEKAQTNTFLSDAAMRAEMKNREGTGFAMPYPRDADRKVINEAIDKLVGEIETKETDKGVAMFSRRAAGVDAAAEAIEALRAVSKDDAAFQLKRSDATTLKGVMETVFPGAIVRSAPVTPEMRTSGIEQDWQITTPGRNGEPGEIAHILEGTALEIYEGAVGEADESRRGKEVWVDLSKLKSGESAGFKIYNAAMDYANNTGKVFVGDPGGLSDIALMRRTELMLSHALKAGTTKHLRPHDKQTRPGEIEDSIIGHAVRPISWRPGDDSHNLRELLLTSYRNVMRYVPELKEVVYNPELDRFEAAQGEVVNDEKFKGLVSKGATRFNDDLWGVGKPRPRGAGPLGMLGDRSPFGSATLKRTAFVNTLLREPSEEVRRDLLGRIGAELSRRGVGALKNAFYSRKGAPQVEGLSTEAVQKLIDRPTRFLRVPVKVYATPEELGKDFGIAVPNDLMGVSYKGRIGLVASNLTSTLEVQQALWHEIFHAGLGRMLRIGGKAYEQALSKIALSNINVTERAAKWQREFGADFAHTLKEHGVEEADIPRMVKLTAFEEALADLSGENETISGIKQFISTIQKILRQIGLGELADWMEGKSNSEALMLIQHAREAVTDRADSRMLTTRNAPAYFSSGKGLHTRTEQAVLGEYGSNWSPAYAKLFGDLQNRQSFLQQGLDGLDGETRRAVERGMRAVSHDRQILDAVIQLIPIDVVDNLRRKQLTPKMVLNDPSMLSNHFSALMKDSVPSLVDVTKNIVSAIARMATERSSVVSDVRGAFPERDTAVGANEGGSRQDSSISSAIDVEKFSRAPQTDTAAFSRSAVLPKAQDFVHDLLKSDRRFGFWHRTIGTQQHKALINPEFKKVYDESQEFISDVSRYANESANLAQDLLPRVEGFKDFFKKSPSKADVNAVGSALMQGTLFGGGNPLEGRLWTDAELKSGRMDGSGLQVFDPLTDKQVELYRQALAAVNTSLDTFGKSLISRYARTHGIAIDREMSLADVVAGVVERLDEKIVEQQTAQETLTGLVNEAEQDVEAQYDRKNPDARNTHHAAIARRDGLQKQLDAATKQLEELAATRTAVEDVQTKTTALQENGYFPAMRFGQFAVYVKEGDEQLFFSLYETQREANAAARDLAKQYPGADITKGLVSQERYKLFQGLSLDALETFAEHMELNADPLIQGFLRAATSQRSALKRQIHRSGLPGFTDDIARSLASFVVSTARTTSSNYHAANMTEYANDIKAGDVQDEAVKLVKYLVDPQEEAAAFRGFLFFNFIGGSIAHGIVNMTQPVMVTAPYLSQHTSYANSIGQLAKAMKDVTTNKTLEPGLKDAVNKAKDAGVVAPQEIHQLRADAGPAMMGKSLVMRKLTHLWGSIYSVTESFNRESTFIAAYRIGEQNKVDDPYQFAVDAVNETQFVYNKGSRPNWARGAPGAIIMTFKTFSISYIELMKRLYDKDKKAFAIMVLTLIAAAGLEGLPFAEDAEDMIDTIGQWLGYGTNSKKTLRKWATNLLGKEAANFALHGVSAGLPVDVSMRLGMHNLIPGTSMLNPSEKNKARDLAEVVGPAGQFIPVEGTAVGRAIERLTKGDLFGATKAAAPVALRNAMIGGEMLNTGEARDTRGKKIANVTTGEAAAKMIGLQPATVAEESRRIGEIATDIDIQRTKEAEIADKWARGLFEKNSELVTEARDELKDWNEKNPELRISLDGGQLIRRLRDMRMERGDRFVRNAPPELRRDVRERLRQP